MAGKKAQLVLSQRGKSSVVRSTGSSNGHVSYRGGYEWTSVETDTGDDVDDPCVKAWQRINIWHSRQKCTFKRSSVSSEFIDEQNYPRFYIHDDLSIDLSSFLRKILRSIPPRNLKLQSCLLMRETKNISHPFRHFQRRCRVIDNIVVGHIEQSRNESCLWTRSEKSEEETKNITFNVIEWSRSSSWSASTIDWDLGVSFQSFEHDLFPLGRLYACGRDETGRVSAGIRGVYRRGTAEELKRTGTNPSGAECPFGEKQVLFSSSSPLTATSIYTAFALTLQRRIVF